MFNGCYGIHLNIALAMTLKGLKCLLHIFGDLFVPVCSWRAMEVVQAPEKKPFSVTFPWVPSKVKDTVALK